MLYHCLRAITVNLILIIVRFSYWYVSKICEKVVFLVELYNFLDEISFFHRFQSVSRPGDSTVMQLIKFIMIKVVK